MEDKIQFAKTLLQKYGIDGWLRYDFQNSNDLGSFYATLDPIDRRPKKIIHQVAPNVLCKFPKKSFIESGIYLPEEFGVRLEYGVYIDSEGIPMKT
ncbi:MAG: hypothetical protein Tsb0015_08540 [Simkaniaceae bacterium]